jgi:hypothetical protein
MRHFFGRLTHHFSCKSLADASAVGAGWNGAKWRKMAHAILRLLAILLLTIVDSAPAPSHISRNCRAQSSAAGVFSYELASVVGAIPVPCSDVPKANQSVMTRMPFT